MIGDYQKGINMRVVEYRDRRNECCEPARATYTKMSLLKINKNLAIANRSRVSCINTTRIAYTTGYIGLNITQRPSNLGLWSLKVSESSTI